MQSIESLSPYNPQNKLATPKDILSIFKKFGLKNMRIYNLALYQQAFVHKSYIKSKLLETHSKPEGVIELFQESNERMEFLGDSVLGCVVVSYLYRRFFEADEGFMTRIKARLVKTDTLGMFAQKIGLDKFLIISQHMETSGEGRSNIRILEDLFEAFIGAMFLDLSGEIKSKKRPTTLFYHPGYSYCETFIINVIEKYIDFEEVILNDENYKDHLLKVFQQHFSCHPKYIVMENPESKNNNLFTIGIPDPDGNIIGRGQGKTKKRAEQKAAEDSLSYFQSN